MRKTLRGETVYLRQVRVLNWHSIYDRTVDVPDSGVLIFGSNGSGKTTLQDAIQFALFPNASTVRFNAAVADSAYDRSLHGYVLQKIEDDGSGRPVYKFQHRITYVALLFERGSERQAFVVGLEGDADGTMDKVMATLPGIPDLRHLPLLDEGRLASALGDLERWIKGTGGHIFDTANGYIEEMRRCQGSPHADWPHLLKSAIGFKEIKDATEFVRRFLGEKAIDHKSLVESYESYEQLREEAERTEHLLQMLDSAVGPDTDGEGNRLPLEQRSALDVYCHYRSLQMKYIVGQVRIPVLAAQLRRREAEAALAHVTSQAEDLERTCDAIEQREKDLERQVSDVRARLSEQGVLDRIENLQEEIERARREVDESIQAGAQVGQYLTRLRALMRHFTARDVREFAADPKSGLQDLDLLAETGIHRLTEFVDDPDGVDLRRAQGFRNLADPAEAGFSRACMRLDLRMTELRQKQAELEGEHASLRRGRPPYPKGVESLRALLRDKLGWQDARPFCEMIDVRGEHEEWRLAVEAELGGARHDFVVPEKLYADASRLYDQYRHKGYPNDSGERDVLYGVRIINIGHIRRDRANRSEQGSLAEVVVCDNADAQDFLVYQLGFVMREYDAQRVSTHRRAVTPDLIYYRSYARGSYDPARIKLVVGAQARLLRIAKLERELAEVHREMNDLNLLAEKVSETHRILRDAMHRYEIFEEQVRKARERKPREERLGRLELQLEKIRQDAEHQDLMIQFTALQKAGLSLRQEAKKAIEDRGKAKSAMEGLEKEIQKSVTQAENAERLFEGRAVNHSTEEWQDGLFRFQEDLDSRVAESGGLGQHLLDQMFETCDRQAGENERKAAAANQRFTMVVAQYQAAAGFPIVATVQDPEPIIAERERLRNTHLPQQKATLAKKAAELKDSIVQNVLHALGGRFAEAQRIVDEISNSTKSVDTRLGCFKLEMKPVPEREHFYELARQAMTVLSFEQLQQTEPDHPFIRSVEEFMAEFLKKETDRDKLCDYRTYLEFEVTNRPIGKANFTKFRGTGRGGSGGERQVPYYVMTFALMDHLYQQGQAKHRLGRLVLMDEVFHNMSDDNVRDVMSLAKQLGLQIVMVTPGKLRTLAPLFGKTIQAAKNSIHPSEPTRFKEYSYDQLPEDLLNFEEYAAGAVHAVA